MSSFTGPDADADRLLPRRWSLDEEPPGQDQLIGLPEWGGEPLLLLIEQQRPLPAELLLQLAASLSPEERQRHGACRRPADRRRFLLARAGLRRWLGAWLKLAPAAVPLQIGPHGKPSCANAPHFNLSHAGDLILLAMHPQHPVGVDVERLERTLDSQRLAQRYFSEAERIALERHPETERQGAFLATWCRLEARLKARGTGLAGLDRLRQEEQLAVDGRPGQTPSAGPGAAVAGSGRSGVARERIWEVQVPAGHCAAVALAPGPEP